MKANPTAIDAANKFGVVFVRNVEVEGGGAERRQEKRS